MAQGGGGSAQGRRQPRQRTDRDGKGLTGGSRQDGDEAGDEDDDEAGDDDGDEDGGLVGEGLRARRGLGEERLGGGDGDGDVDNGSGAGRRRRARGSGRRRRRRRGTAWRRRGEWEQLAKFSQVLPYIAKPMVPVRGAHPAPSPHKVAAAGR